MLYSPKTKKNLLAVLIALFCYSDRVAADPMVEFNTDVLDASDRKNVDLKRFSSDNYVVPGNYLLDIRVNGQAVSQQNVIYRATANNADTSFVCLTPEQVDFLALKKEAQEKIHHVDPQCLDIKAIPGVELNNHEGILDITVPQAWMKYNDPDWVPPERWDDGVAGLVFDYSLSGQMTHQLKEGDSTHSLSAYGQTGFNAGAWRMRGEYQANYDNDGQHNLDWNQVYAYRPLPSLASKLTVGEIYLNSQVFDTVRFTGINMISDERMLPPSLQGYAPEIHGIAKSNAKVTVSQSGRVIYETTVPAGPFNIQDLRSSVRGTLDVKVEEQDGSVSTFQVNTANIPYLTRPGYVRYNTSIGKPSRYNHQLEGPAFYVGDFSWGISNAWSLYGGTMLTGNDYNAWSLGLGRDLNVLGALSADVTQSISRVPIRIAKKGCPLSLATLKPSTNITVQSPLQATAFLKRHSVLSLNILMSVTRNTTTWVEKKRCTPLRVIKPFGLTILTGRPPCFLPTPIKTTGIAAGKIVTGSRLGVLSDWLVSMASQRTYLLGVQTIRVDAMTALPSRSPSRSAIAAGWAMTYKTAQAARLS